MSYFAAFVIKDTTSPFYFKIGVHVWVHTGTLTLTMGLCDN